MPDGSLVSELPASLQNALGEFEAWMQGELLADQVRSTPTAPLYHYTGEAALRGILEHRRPGALATASNRTIPRSDIRSRSCGV
jgi:hypothetical protein